MMSRASLSDWFSHSLSRREFLKLGGMGLFSLMLTPFKGFSDLLSEYTGRVIPAAVDLMAEPSFKSRRVRQYWKDMVLPITEVTIGDEEPAHNRVWYRIRDEGYLHSGEIQPVRTQVNPPDPNIPPEGTLAEVTVPFTDAYRAAGKNFPVAYRFYYETTYWVIRLVTNPDGQYWYLVQDDKREDQFYVPAEHLRLVPREELSPLSPEVPPIGKRIEIHNDKQVLIAYEWDRPVYMTRTATGARFSNGNYATPSGRHLTFHKRPSRHMAAGNLAYNGYDLPGVPWISYITESGIALHGTYWHNNFGRPRSHGCINLSSQAAKWVYRWTLPTVPPFEQRIYEDYGTPVDVI
jgi:hypothetical protein